MIIARKFDRLPYTGFYNANCRLNVAVKEQFRSRIFWYNQESSVAENGHEPKISGA